jgi:hypothetical protein
MCSANTDNNIALNSDLSDVESNPAQMTATQAKRSFTRCKSVEGCDLEENSEEIENMDYGITVQEQLEYLPFDDKFEIPPSNLKLLKVVCLNSEGKNRLKPDTSMYSNMTDRKEIFL